MKTMRRSSGFQRRLLDASVEAYIHSLEIINRLSVTYRIETFTYLLCNAWELLLKAKVIQDASNSRAVFYKRKRGQPRRSLSLRDCLKIVLTNENDPIRRNIELVEELRDEATHLIIRQVPPDVLGLFQACVVNYHNRLNEWFGVSLSKRVNVGMMAIIYDIDPGKFDLKDKALRRRLGQDTAVYLAQFQAKVRESFVLLGQPTEFCISIGYKLALTKKPGDGDIVLTTGDSDKALGIVEVAKDPGLTHPYRTKELVQEMNRALEGATTISVHDIYCVNVVFNTRKNQEFYYKGRVQGSPVQYSQAFVRWLVKEYHKDPAFFTKVREKAKSLSSADSSVEKIASVHQHIALPDVAEQSTNMLQSTPASVGVTGH